MKKHLKFLILLLIFFNSTIYVRAQCDPNFEICDGTTPPNPGNGGGNVGDGTGGRSTPIDNYLPLLIISAIVIGGAISYRQKELFTK